MSSRAKTMTVVDVPAGEAAISSLDHKKIARLAYAFWEARGRPHGSPDEDWFRAEEELRRRKSAYNAAKERRRRKPASQSREGHSATFMASQAHGS